MSYEGLMNKTATIQRATTSRNARGNVSPTWADGSTGVRCQVQALSVEQQMELRGFKIEADARILVPAGTDVKPDPRAPGDGGLPDRVVVESQKYLAVWAGDKSGRGKTLTIYARRHG